MALLAHRPRPSPRRSSDPASPTPLPRSSGMRARVTPESAPRCSRNARPRHSGIRAQVPPEPAPRWLRNTHWRTQDRSADESSRGCRTRVRCPEGDFSGGRECLAHESRYSARAAVPMAMLLQPSKSYAPPGETRETARRFAPWPFSRSQETAASLCAPFRAWGT